MYCKEVKIQCKLEYILLSYFIIYECIYYYIKHKDLLQVELFLKIYSTKHSLILLCFVFFFPVKSQISGCHQNCNRHKISFNLTFKPHQCCLYDASNAWVWVVIVSVLVSSLSCFQLFLILTDIIVSSSIFLCHQNQRIYFHNLPIQ